MKLSFDDLSRHDGPVRARRRIEDCPASVVQHPAAHGAVGAVVDVDFCNSIVFVEFNGPGSAIACTPDELAAA